MGVNMTSVTNTTSTPIDEQTLSIVGSYLIGFIIISGALGNSTVVYVIFRNEELRRLQHYVLIGCLATSDLCFNVLVMPFYIRDWYYQNLIDPKELCYYYTFFGTFLIEFSGFLILCIAINRYILVVHLSLWKKMEKLSVTLIELLIIALLAFASMIYSFTNVDVQITYMHRLSRCNWDRTKSKPVVYGIFVGCVLIPFVLVSVLYILLMDALRRSRNRVLAIGSSIATTNAALETFQGQNLTVVSMEPELTTAPRWTITELHSSGSVELSMNERNNEPDSAQIRREHNRKVRDSRSFRVIIAVFLAYFLTLLPFSLLHVIDEPFGLHRKLYMILNLFFWMSTMVNPWIYGIMNSELRRAIKSSAFALRKAIKTKFSSFSNCCTQPFQ